MTNSNADVNLLFGILALHMDFIDRDGLIGAMHDWILNKERALGDLLVEKAGLTPEHHALLTPLVQAHLKKHGGDVEKSLAAIQSLGNSLSAVSQDLISLGDAEVEHTLSLVSSHSGAPVSRPGVRGDPYATVSHAPLPEERLRFRPVRRHARGGLGEVWLAHDEELYRMVALKQLRESRADDTESRSRFVLEARITGGLEHPSIVPVYALGDHVDGRPYYAMKFIRGRSLKDEIAEFHKGRAARPSSENMLGYRALLNRFVQVCQAIEYAHSRGVVHRDIKPANIMLGSFGETLVVDWGLAKTVGRGSGYRGSSEATLRFSNSVETRIGSAVGTPAYMSPEQLEHAESVGPLSDVYSLGATLYCLLTGQPPFDEKDLDLDRLVSPSSRYTSPWRRGVTPRPPRQINGYIDASLEAICVKAIACEPHQRYPSASALAEDVQRWLADEPVSARKETPGEHVARWMRRHRTWVQAAAVTVAMMIVTLAGAAIFANHARIREQQARLDEQAAKREAMVNFRLARGAIDDWVTGPAVGLQYWAEPGVQRVREMLLEHAAQSYQQFSRRKSNDGGLELERGRTLLRLGDLRQARGELEDARSAFEKARKVFTQFDSEDYPDALLELGSAETRLANVLATSGASNEADGIFARGIKRLRETASGSSASWQSREALGAALLNRGLLLTAMANGEEAIRVLRESLDLLQRAVEASGGVPRTLHGLNAARQALVAVFLESGNLTEAEAVIRTTVASMNKLLTTDVNANPEHLESRSTARSLLASVLELGGSLTEAIQSRREARSDLETIVRAFPDVVRYRSHLAVQNAELARLFYRDGRTADALQAFQQALPILSELTTNYPLISNYREDYAACESTLGQVLCDLERSDEAERAFQAADASFRELLETYPDTRAYKERIAVNAAEYGLLKARQSKYHEAIDLLHVACDVLEGELEAAPGRNASNEKSRYVNELALMQTYRGTVLLDAGQGQEAKQAFQQALLYWQQLGSEGTPLEYMHSFAWFLASCADKEFRSPRQAIDLAEMLTLRRPSNADYWGTLAAAYSRADRFADAQAACGQAITRREQPQAKELLLLAIVQWRLGDRGQSKATYEQGLAWMQQHRPGNDLLRRLAAEAELLLKDAP